MRVNSRSTWVLIASEIGFASHRACMKSAKKYARMHQLPWPVVGMTKGRVIYSARRIGLTWHSIANRYNQNIDQVWRCAYKYASRHNKPWPPE